MIHNSCECNLNSSYCYELYGCLGDNIILKAGLQPGTVYDVYFENIFGDLFIETVTADAVTGDLLVPINEPDGIFISPISEHLMLFVTLADGGTPVKLSLGTDGETYDNVLLKFHGSNVGKNIIQ